MKHVVLRIQGLATVYLHRAGTGFQWSEEHDGRHEFESYEEAVAAIEQVGGRGIAAPIDPPAPAKHKPPAEPHHAEPAPEPGDWLTKWERNHEP